MCSIYIALLVGPCLSHSTEQEMKPVCNDQAEHLQPWWCAPQCFLGFFTFLGSCMSGCSRRGLCRVPRNTIGTGLTQNCNTVFCLKSFWKKDWFYYLVKYAFKLLFDTCMAALTWLASPCSLAAELASIAWTAAPSLLPPTAGYPATAFNLSAPHSSYAQAWQEKPGPDQLPRTGSGLGDRGLSNSSRAESRGSVEAKAAANTYPAERAG